MKMGPTCGPRKSDVSLVRVFKTLLAEILLILTFFLSAAIYLAKIPARSARRLYATTNHRTATTIAMPMPLENNRA